MGKDEPGWYYVGNGRLRYKDGWDWTDQYKDIDKASATQPMSSQSSSPTSPTVPPKTKKLGRRTATLVALCLGLLGVGVGAGLVNAGPLHGLGSWASGQVSALTSPTPSPAHASALPTARAAVKVKTPLKAAPLRAAPTTAEPKPVAPVQVAPPKVSPVHAPVSRPSPSPRPTTHTRTVADCSGFVVATSHVISTGGQATLTGVVKNETGFDVRLNVQGPSVEAWDSNGEHMRLHGDFNTPPLAYGGYNLFGVIHPGGTLKYRSVSVEMLSPDRRWAALHNTPVASYFEGGEDVWAFCGVADVPYVETVE